MRGTSQEMESPPDGSRVGTSMGTDHQARTLAPVTSAGDSKKLVGDQGGVAQQDSCSSSSKTTLTAPTACSAQSECVDPIEFSLEMANLSAADLCLDAACALLQFEIAEIWTYVGDVSPSDGKAVEPQCLHVYVRPATIESYGDKVKGVWAEGNTRARHVLSHELVARARKEEGIQWFTSSHEDNPLHASLSLNTAVTLPVSLAMFRKDLSFVFFGQQDVQRTDTAVSTLTQLSKAAGVSISATFPAQTKDNGHGNGGRDHPEESQARSSNSTTKIPTIPEEPPVDLNMRWDELKDLEFMVNGSRCTIYTAFYCSMAVVVKVVRKDAIDKEVVRKELDLEIDLLMRLRHPNIVRFVGAGNQPERFMVIERLDGGTLAQRCGNSLKIRDRRRRFRHKRPFTYEEILRQGEQMAQALKYMHNDAIQGKMVLHRDLKPDNIGFDSQGNLKLIDLGLGRVVNEATEDNAVYQMTGQTGSLRYMAPEVAMDRPYNGAADVYGFAMILWEMSTMTKPFESMDYPMFMSKVVYGGFRPHLSRNWQPEFSALLESCWHSDMHKRMKFDDILITLRRLLENAATKADQARYVQRSASGRFRFFRNSRKAAKATAK